MNSDLVLKISKKNVFVDVPIKQVIIGVTDYRKFGR